MTALINKIPVKEKEERKHNTLSNDSCDHHERWDRNLFGDIRWIELKIVSYI